MMEFKDPRRAFDEAITQDRLSRDFADYLYAGHYMYMYTSEGEDFFKRIDNRQYLPSQKPPSEPDREGRS